MKRFISSFKSLSKLVKLAGLPLGDRTSASANVEPLVLRYMLDTALSGDMFIFYRNEPNSLQSHRGMTITN